MVSDLSASFFLKYVTFFQGHSVLCKKLLEKDMLQFFTTNVGGDAMAVLIRMLLKQNFTVTIMVHF